MNEFFMKSYANHKNVTKTTYFHIKINNQKIGKFWRAVVKALRAVFIQVFTLIKNFLTSRDARIPKKYSIPSRRDASITKST